VCVKKQNRHCFKKGVVSSSKQLRGSFPSFPAASRARTSRRRCNLYGVPFPHDRII
jgi:hypothetical protein